jgi:hypothetical protein
MRFRIRKTVFHAHDGQWLPVDDSIEEIHPILHCAEAT